MKTRLSLIISFFAFSQIEAFAQTAIVDTFSSGSALTGRAPDSGLGGATWTNISGTTGLTVSGGTLSIAAAAGEASQLNFSASNVASGTYYMGFDFTVSSSGTISTSDTIQAIAGFRSGTAGSGSYALSFGDFRPSTNAQTFSGAPSTTTSQVDVGIFTGSSLNATTSALTAWSSPLSRGTTYRVVLGIDASNNTGTLWINPASSGSTSITITGITLDPRGVYLREGASSHGAITIDNLSFTSDFNTAAAIPEPSTYAALFGVAALIGAIWQRRRRK